MIIHKTFSGPTVGSQASAKREKIRGDAEKFIADEINEEDIVSITETAVTSNGFFSVTVWYRKR